MKNDPSFNLGMALSILQALRSSTMELADWRTPATAYPRKQVGTARIASHHYHGLYECYGVGGYRFFRANRPITITNLKINNQVWMVDDPPHWLGMLEHAGFYKGHVVCAGLGLGLIVHALALNPVVTKITVVERSQDVIDLVGSLVPKCEIIHGDFWNWDGDPDGILFDLFVGNGRELVQDAIAAFVRLRLRFPGATIRIHGFLNDVLNTMAAQVISQKHHRARRKQARQVAHPVHERGSPARRD